MQPVSQRLLECVRDLNDVTRRVARGRMVPVLDVRTHPGLDREENFLDDGLHPSPSGQTGRGCGASLSSERCVRDCV